MICHIPPRNTTGKSNLAYWEGFLTPKEISYLLNLKDWENTIPACVGGNNRENTNSVNLGIRRTDVTWLDRNPETEIIWQKLADITAEVNRQFFQFDLTGFYEPIQLGLYAAENAGHYDWHTDACFKDRLAPRKLSMALMLSDLNDFEGGDLEVKTVNDVPHKLELAQGRAWFFASHTLHRVTPVTKGIRKSLVLWAGGPQFK